MYPIAPENKKEYLNYKCSQVQGFIKKKKLSVLHYTVD